ncbi:hypothetical protein FOL47_011361 [Perkinsus chesapeaki]|uniref:C3H1-type domain-containing protein n=1 Tax=Perkinsus chesapeaki TaxID=330153 RepID=A0A7J6MMH6_PERCH|nr:hypothetical protein FOL47_011361 [Perkinsus chesapeaki]
MRSSGSGGSKRSSVSSHENNPNKKKKKSKGPCYDFLANGVCKRSNCPYAHRKASGKAEKGENDAPKKGSAKPIGPPLVTSGEVHKHLQNIADLVSDNAREEERLLLESLVDGTGERGVLSRDDFAKPTDSMTHLVNIFLEEVEILSSPRVVEKIMSWAALDRESQSESTVWNELESSIQVCAERIRNSWGAVLGVPTRSALAGGPIRAPLVEAVLRKMQKDGAWPTYHPKHKHDYQLSRDLWRNYESAEHYSEEVTKTIEAEITADRMAVIDRGDLGQVRAVTRLACIPHFKEDGTIRKVRLIDDMRRSGANCLREPNLQETILLPSIRSAVAAVLQDEGSPGPSSPGRVFWLESDIRSAFRLVPLAEPDTWFCVNKVHEGFVRHLMLPFGATSSPLIFVRASSGVALIECRVRRQAELHPRVIIYVDDRGSKARAKQLAKATLISILVDAVCGVPTATEKLHASTTPHCLGFVMDLDRGVLTIPHEKCTTIGDALLPLTTVGSLAVVKDLERLTGRLSWVAGAFKRINPFLSSFYSTLKVAESKGLRSITVGRNLAYAARFLRHFISADCSIPFNSLLPELGTLARAVVVFDASGGFLGGVVFERNPPGCGHSFYWYHLDLNDERVVSSVKQILGYGDEVLEGICFHELLSAALGILLTDPSQPVVVVSDNVACVRALQKMRSKSAALNCILERLMLVRPGLAAPSLYAQHLAGELNILADQISRSDIQTNRSIFYRVDGAVERDALLELAKLTCARTGGF